jgi:hypothetical protein
MFTNGRAIIAWTDGFIWYWDGYQWYNLGVVWKSSVVYSTASAWINAVANQYSSYFGTKSGSVQTLTDSSGTYYQQLFTNGKAIAAYTDGYIWWWDGSSWHNLGVAWR